MCAQMFRVSPSTCAKLLLWTPCSPLLYQEGLEVGLDCRDTIYRVRLPKAKIANFLPFAFVVFVAVPLNIGRNLAITATSANHLRGNLWRKTAYGGVAIAATRPDLGQKWQNCLCSLCRLCRHFRRLNELQTEELSFERDIIKSLLRVYP
jgi:hypothetical protein